MVRCGDQMMQIRFVHHHDSRMPQRRLVNKIVMRVIAQMIERDVEPRRIEALVRAVENRDLRALLHLRDQRAASSRRCRSSMAASERKTRRSNRFSGPAPSKTSPPRAELHQQRSPRRVAREIDFELQTRRPALSPCKPACPCTCLSATVNRLRAGIGRGSFRRARRRAIAAPAALAPGPVPAAYRKDSVSASFTQSETAKSLCRRRLRRWSASPVSCERSIISFFTALTRAVLELPGKFRAAEIGVGVRV